MFRNDPKLRCAGELVPMGPEELAEWARCADDFIHWATHWAFITTLDKKNPRQVIAFREYQLRMMNGITKLKGKGKQGMVVVAPRQSGKTTGFYLYLLWLVIFHGYTNCAIVSNKMANAKKVLRTIKQTFRDLPLWMQQGITEGGWNKESIELENGSMIITGTAQSESIRGGSFAAIYADELAFIPKHHAEDFMKGVLPAIMSGDDSMFFATSTPKGRNHFYSMVRSAKNPDSFYEYFEVKWQEVPRYTEEFRRKIIATEGIRYWNQEYDCQFLGSAKTLIPPETIEEMGYEDPISEDYDGDLRIWEPPIDGQLYILCGDPSKGVGGDYSVYRIIKVDTSPRKRHSEVALFRSNIRSIDEQAQACIGISDWYNKCEMVIENNDLGYLLTAKIWYQYDCDRVVCYEKGILGVRSSKRNKHLGNLAMREMLTDGSIEIKDRHTVWELSVYEENSAGGFAALAGEHDDCVTSLLWGCYWINATFNDESEEDTQLNPKFHISDKARGRFATAVAEGGDGEFVGGRSARTAEADEMSTDFVDADDMGYGHRITEDSLFAGYGEGNDAHHKNSSDDLSWL